MIEINEALSLVIEKATPIRPQRVATSDALGLVLAEDVTSDIDSPPHNKSMVDGYAVVAADLESGSATLSVLEEVTAGDVPTKDVASGFATRIMTGAPIPNGASAVVMVEQTKLVDSDQVSVRQADIRVGQNIMPRATSLSCGEVVLKAGQEIRPIEIGLLAEVGRTDVLVTPRPTVAALSTGNELVAVSDMPAKGQIRNSNGPMLSALVRRAGGQPVELGIARDTEEDLRRLIGEGLTQEVLVLSGGVSAGVLDLVPCVLSELGVEQVFHKVSLKPGKPLWFGVLSRDNSNTLVFGLPGNPVSSLVCFELFARPAIDQLAGRCNKRDERRAKLARSHIQRGPRPVFWPSVLRGEQVEPLAWQGSADMRSLTEANCLAFFPAEDREFQAGEEVVVRQL